MEDYAGRILVGRYRLPLPPSDEYEPAETRAFDTRSGQEVLVRQVPLPEIVDAELVDGEAAGYAAEAPRPPYPSGPGRRPAGELPAVRRAIAAAQAAASVPDHPRLDQVFDVFAEGGSLWIVSELVPARPLAALLAEEPLTPYRAAEVASDVLTALRVLHAHGWTHRNITVRTVLICDDGRVVLTGLAAGAAEDALCGYDPVPPEDDDPPAEDAWGAPPAPAAPPYAPLIAPGYETAPRPADPTSPNPQLPPGYAPSAGPAPGHTGRAVPERPLPPGIDPPADPGPAAGPRYADHVAPGPPLPSGGGPSAPPGPGTTGRAVPEPPGLSGRDAQGLPGAVVGPRYADHIVPGRDAHGAGLLGGGAAGEGGLLPGGAADRAPLVAPGYETGPRGGAAEAGASRAVAAHGPGPESATARVPAEAAPGSAPERRPIGSKLPQGYAYPYGGPKAPETPEAAEAAEAGEAGDAAPPSEAPSAPPAPPAPAPAPAPPGRSGGGPADDGPHAGADVPWHGATPRRQAALPPGLPQGYRHADDDTAPLHAPGLPAPAGGPAGPAPARRPDAPGGDSRPLAAPAGGPAGPIPARLPHAPAGPAGPVPAGLHNAPVRPGGTAAPATAGAPRGERPGPRAAYGGGPVGAVPARLPGARAGAPAAPGGRPGGGDPAAAEGAGGGRPAPGAAARGPRTGLDAERARQTRMAVVGAVTERWAPEQARTVAGPWQIAAPVGPATDLWALGALLYRAVQGHPPYPEDSAAELVEMVCSEPPAFAEECGPLRPVVESLLRQDPTERPDFEELRGWLRSLVRSAPEPDAAPGALPPAEPDPARLPAVRRRGDLHGRHRNPAPRRGPRRLGRVLLAGVLALTAGAVAYAVLFLPRAGEGQDRDAASQTPVAKTETPSPQAPRSPAPSATPGPSQPAPQAPASAPPGYTVQQDPEHFEIAVPQGWERRGMNEAGQVRYTDGQYVLIVVPGRDKVEGSPDPATYQKDKEPELAPYRSSTWASGGDVKTTKVGQQLRATGRYTWIDGTGRSVVARNFVVALGGSYHVVMVMGPQDGEGKVTEVFEKATGSYKSGG
ncbi:serine/threonine protein kinase [Streptomyces globosus]|uniref:Serine/threonine protein kinase n=1 Tax=Streptomyces globosus TaxID=68209 RepID=A0A344TVB5_9ACTN|nr:protein kinase [Streptomyces globosus]AXE22586.1 serine/threonine protein kinase [Streptomyces globosus]